MKIFSFIYNAFMYSLLIAIILFQWQWLEMRINIGFVIPIITAVITILFAMFHKNNKEKIVMLGFKQSLISTIISMGAMFIILGNARIMVVPSSIIREGLGMTSLKFGVINMCLIAFIVISLGIIYVGDRKCL